MKFKRRGVDFWQNTAIALLTVSAVLLFSQTELFRLGWKAMSGSLQVVSKDALSVEEDAPPASALSAPLRLSVSGGGGRYASISMTSVSAAFPRRLFARALEEPAERAGTAQTDFTDEAPKPSPAERADSGAFSQSRRADFLRALDGTSIYCDFLCPLPLGVAAGLTGASARSDQTVRCALLAEEGNSVALYLWDGGEGYFRRNTPLSIGELEAAARREGLEDAFFAMDRISLEKGCQNVAPLSLLLEQTPSLPVLSALSGVSDADRLLTTLHFNPRTHSHYTEPNGTEVILEDGRSVRMRADGSVYYQSGGRAELAVDCAGDAPTDWEAAAGCAALLDAIFYQDSAAQICLTEVVREDGRIILRFGYHWNGIPIYLAERGSAAAVVLEGNAVASLELLPRRFFPTEEIFPLLPRTQALGVAGLAPGAELSIGYAASGTRARAHWISG